MDARPERELGCNESVERRIGPLRLVREKCQIDRFQELTGEICIAMSLPQCDQRQVAFQRKLSPRRRAIGNSCSSVSGVRRIGLDFFGLFGMKCDRHRDDDSPGTTVGSRAPSSS